MKHLIFLLLFATGLFAHSVPRTDDLHADMINSVLKQHPDRYEFIKEILIAEPDRVDAMTMRIVIDVDHKHDSKQKTETMLLLTAAVIARDAEMVKLLVENNAMICSTPNNIMCALGVARKLGYQEIIEILYAELLRRKEVREEK